MKISIDTKEDSHEEIRKVIRMLQHLVGENPLSTDSSPSSALPTYGTEATSAFGALFGSDTTSSSSVSSVTPSNTAITDEYGKAVDMNKPVDDTPELETY